jgi:hypothetical protein
MDFSIALENINWLAVAIAFALSMVWGGIYYSPNVIGDLWAKVAGVKYDKDGGSNLMVIAAVLSFVSAFVMGLFQTTVDGVVDGVFTGLVLGVLVLANLAIMYSFALRRKKQLLIDGISILVSFALMGVVFGIVGVV